MHLTKSVVAEFIDQEAHLQVLELELPPLGPTSVLVKVCACALASPEEERSKRVLLKGKVDEEAGLIYVGQDVAGVVKAVGMEVCGLKAGDRVVGIVPLDYKQSGCSSYVILQEFDVAPIPDGISFVEAAASIGDAVNVYTALHYLGRLNSGDTVLLLGSRLSFASIFVQLAHHWSAKTIVAVRSVAEEQYLGSLSLKSVHVIKNPDSKGLKPEVMLETGGLGADIIIDLMHNRENIPGLHDIISCLSVGGRLVTSDPKLQLDPPHSRMLFLRCASVGFLFEQAWILSTSQQGRYQHILMDIMEKVATKTLRPLVDKTIPKLEEACEALKTLQANEVWGKVVLNMS